MADEDDLKLDLVRKLASRNVTGAHKKQMDTVKRWGVASHDQGKAKRLLEEMVRDPEAPVEQYGGRETIRLTSLAAAKEYIEALDGELPWGLRE